MYILQIILVFTKVQFFLLVYCENQEGYYCYGNGVLEKSSPCRFFAVVFDAGSTGTRLHLYRYVHNIDMSGIPFIVEEEIFQEVKPGLSSYSSNPKGAAESLRILMERARSVIPHFMWEKTPVALKATAGLRLLPGDMADEILSEVEHEIFNSGLYAIPNAVSIMSGSDEGMYSWFTLNLLLNTLYSNDPSHPSSPVASNSVAAFDLGGGSTQLTFWPEDFSIFEKYPQFERDISFFGNRLRLFIHSFLGNGLVAARLNILYGSTEDKHEEKEQLTSSCLPDGYQISDWEYALKLWTINGTANYSYDACYMSTRNFVKSSEIMPLHDLRGKLIYLFSYFFDRALNSGLVMDTNGGQIKLCDFHRVATIACSRSASDLDGPHWMPWQCHDLTYIYSLMKDGYEFEDDQPIFLAKKIKGMEVAWGQGLSYAVVNQFHESQVYAENSSNNTVVYQLISYLYIGTTNVLSYFNIIS